MVTHAITEDIVIYKGPKGNVTLRAQVEKDTMWASLSQIADLFGVQKAAVSKHIKNIYQTGELSQRATVSILETVQNEGKRTIHRSMEYYNLDVMIAVGYRVNSKQATTFRKWATETLRDFMLHGYVLNRQRLIESKQNTIKGLEKTVDLIRTVASRKYLEQDEIVSLLDVIKGYAHSWFLLQEYDEGSLTLSTSTKKVTKQLAYESARHAIDALRVELVNKGEASDLFGNERDGTFAGILKSIYQTFGGKELYKSIEEKAAHLLYFIIKDHPFSDGNKRIGSFLFIIFLQQNGILRNKNGEKKLHDNTLVALALLVAESNPKEKEQIVALITQLIR